jgi:small-conductance mechanosensitive channel
MASPFNLESVSSFFNSMGQWLAHHLLNGLGLLQVGIAAVTYLFAWYLAGRIEHFLVEKSKRAELHFRFRFSPEHFALVARYVLWLLFLGFCRLLFERLVLPVEVLRIAHNLALALLLVRFASFYIKSRLWARVFYGVALAVIALRLVHLWQPAVDLLNGLSISLGAINFSLWELIKAITIFIVLWAAGSAIQRLFAHWLMGSTHMTYSDRVLIQRVFNSVIVVAVVLVSLNAAGIHMTALAVTGGAFGLAIGFGLQKAGANLVAGVLLLVNKPIRQGDVIAMEDKFSSADYGWVTRMDLLYVHVATRDGTEHLVPNETFIERRIENLSYSDNRVRLRIPFGVSYKSDLKKTIKLALDAARATDRVLKAPEPNCVVKHFGDSNVELELRVWIEDPRQGVGRVRSAVLLAVWDSFHANGIVFAFPQRDLHIVEDKTRAAVDRPTNQVKQVAGGPDEG